MVLFLKTCALHPGWGEWDVLLRAARGEAPPPFFGFLPKHVGAAQTRASGAAWQGSGISLDSFCSEMKYVAY